MGVLFGGMNVIKGLAGGGGGGGGAAAGGYCRYAER